MRFNKTNRTFNLWFAGLSVLISAGFSMFIPLSALAAVNSDCLVCHGQKNLGALFVDEAAFNHSIHGKNLCISCHQDAATLPHPDKLASVSCSNCHRVETEIYLNSDHGKAISKGRKEAAACKDCHGHSHTLLNSRDPDSPVNRRNIPQTCGRCHADAKRMANFHLTERNPLDSYNHTVHGEAFAKGNINAAVCSDCHGTHDLHGSLNPQSRLFKTNIPDTCGRCHQNVNAVYKQSIHGQAIANGVKEAPVCTDCHGEHTIRSPQDASSSVWSGTITKTCSRCHDSEQINLKFGLPTDSLATYLDTYHGLAYKRGDLRVANCASCHGFHDVLPASDPRSSINPANLANTCGRCHPGASRQLSTGYIHGSPTPKHFLLSWVKLFYLILIPLVIGFMLLHNFLDWFRKSLDPVSPQEDEGPVRLTVNERWQHALLMTTFILLAYTGFALKFHEAACVKTFAPFGEELRRSIHRWCALLFCLLGVYHFLYLFLTERGRFILRSLLPVWKDAGVFFQCFAFNLGLRKTPPHHKAFYHYPEKMEYWSLVWGSVIMVATGCILVFNNFALKHFPLWLLDLATFIHYYEAVLACLAIAVWHFYGVIFDPSVYPMNWAWLIGRLRIKKAPEK
jgi:cytochrome b subunit of formate dehydrogenase